MQENSINKILLTDGIPKKENLMAYISGSCDFPKVKMERWVAYIIIWWDQSSFFGNLMAYVSRSCDFPKSENGEMGLLHNQMMPSNYQKRKY